MALTNLKLNTFNCRGIGNANKRRAVFEWLQNHHKGITFLQETHSSLACEQRWQREWKGKMYFNHGTAASKGVAILVHQSLDIDINCVEMDDQGRILLLDMSSDFGNSILINVYFPTKDTVNQQIKCIDSLSELIRRYADREMVIGGDFNIVFDQYLDKRGGKHDTKSTAVSNLEELMNDLNLIDVWRTLHPDSVQCTRRQVTRSGLVQSRLDFWLISTHMLYDVDECEIVPGFKSDHSLVKLSFRLNEKQTRGRGFFKFNSMLLKDKDYVTMIKDTIDQFSQENVHTIDKAILWDCLKCVIRGKTISYSTARAKKQKQMENYLLKKIEALEKNLTENNMDEYKTYKAELESIYDVKSKGEILRSKARIIDLNEKPSKFFLNQEINNYKNKHIRKLIVDNKTIMSPDGILQEEASFYTKLNTSQTCENDYKDFETDVPNLNDNHRTLCDQDITEYELGKSLAQLANNKTPGSDGLSVEFYKFFWPDIKHIVHNSFKYSFEQEILSIEQRRGILNIIPKKGKDLRYLKNWRPISLLNTDYKILTKLLAHRLQIVIPNIVSSNQTGYIKNRYAGENIRTIADIMRYTSLQNVPSILLQLDFEKAFDSVSWDFLHHTLKKYNFGPKFRKWIKIIYNKPEFCVTNNGYHSQFITMGRGIRQGCPISSLLFVLVVEIMAISIRKDEAIKGVTVGGTEFKISQLADDTTLFVKDIESVKKLLTFLDRFSKVSGLTLNQSKTEAIWLGKIINDNDKPLGLNWNTGYFKCLGIWCHTNPKLMIEKNYTERLTKIKATINIWKQRKLSLKGKITVLWSMVLPQMLYVSSMLYTPKWVIDQTDKIMFDFLWSGKKPQVKKSSIIAEISEGGLRMLHFECMVKAIKINWIKRFLNNDKHLTNLISTLLGLNISIQYIVTCFLDKVQLDKIDCDFYRQILTYWNELHKYSSATPDMLYNQTLWYNSNIQIGNSSVLYKSWSSHGINSLSDIMNCDGIFKTKEAIESQYNTTIRQMEYNSLLHAIPAECRDVIRQSKVCIDEKILTFVKLKGKLYDISNVQCKQIYQAFVSNITQSPTAIGKWNEKYTLDHDIWTYFFKLPFDVCCDTELQSLQYKIIHRFFPCNYTLSIWFDDVQCECKYFECTGVVDNIQHYFCHCHSVAMFWKSFMKFWYNVTGCNFMLGEVDIIFGILNPFNCDNIDILNYCILFAKQFIYNCKKDEKRICLYEFLVKLKNRIEVLHTIAIMQDKQRIFRNKWECITTYFDLNAEH